MAATRKDAAALAALTSAALALPGLHASADTVGQAAANAFYGHYEEGDNRMQVDVYHGDFVMPVSDRMEFTFSVDRDTYSGATPAYSLPNTMTNQVRLSQSGPVRVDAVSAASAGVTAQGLTTLGGLNTFKKVSDGVRAEDVVNQAIVGEQRTVIDEKKNADINNWVTDNPKPELPPTIPGPVTIDFEALAFSAYYGKGNVEGGCNGVGSDGCYFEPGSNFVVGTIFDSSPGGLVSHLHAGRTLNSGFSMTYHADSPGIYVRATGGEAFSLSSLDFLAPIDPRANPGNGASDFWQILGLNTAYNPNLDTGDGKNYPTVVASQTVLNGYNGSLALSQDFSNINALWIHYNGFPATPGRGVYFQVDLDNLKLDKANLPNSTPEQQAWLAQYDEFLKGLDGQYAGDYAKLAALGNELSKQSTIRQYRSFLNQLVPKSAKPVQRFQTQPVETRTMPVFGAKYHFDNATLAFSGGHSSEPDFQSRFGSVNLSRDFNNKLTTVSAGYSYTRNDVSRSGGFHLDHHATDPAHNPTDYAPLDAHSDYNGFNLGLSQVIDKNTLLQVSGNYTRQSGYLTNPYKYVYVRGEITPEEYYQLSQAAPGQVNWNSITKLEVVGIELFREARPDLRNLASFSGRLNRHFPVLDASLHFDYRYYFDDWGIDSHTFQLQWFQKLPWGLTVTPSIRYYSQSAADFYAPYFLAPRADGHYSSDFRLSGYGALSGGISLSKQFTRGIKLDIGMEYFTHQGGLKLGGGGSGDFADFDYWMAHANLNVALSGPGQGLFEEGEHGHHAHHLAHPNLPAGVMFGHTLDKAGDVMVGYRYSYANQSGGLYGGSRAIGDGSVIAKGCPGARCLSAPRSMTMHMHMLDLMYAPMDWLSLMVMPQLMDMDMKLSPLSGATGTGEHNGGHESHGLGDTLTAALVKVVDVPGHRVHFGLGVSAPTGDVHVTQDGFDKSSSQLQDYGMQLGSGTWDFRPSLTYTGQAADWSWGAQLSATKRMEKRNASGYRLGDGLQATAWGAYRINPWLSLSLRGTYSEQGKIRGRFNRSHATSAPVDFTANYGGEFWDAGFGLNLTVPEGLLAGHRFGVEWQQPIADRYNGVQLEREGSLAATWNFMF